jgi:flagellar biosynthesis protein FlhF
MKIKRYFAPDIKQAMRMVREEMGPDAVIMSNRKVEGGVEIVAAQDFEEEQALAAPVPSPAPAPYRNEYSAPAREMPARTESQRRAEEVFREALDAYAQRQAAATPEPAPKPARNAEYASPRAELPPARTTPRPQESFKPRTPSVSSLETRQPERSGEERLKSILSADESRTPPILRERPREELREDRPKPAPNLTAGKAPPSRPLPKSDAAEPERESSKALQELQQEMRKIRRALDRHFSRTAWDNSNRAAPLRLDLLRRLCNLGFSRKIALPLANRLGAAEDLDLAWQGCCDLLGGQAPVVEDNLLDYGGIVALVGPTGVGKTTTIAKLAARFRLKNGPRQVALITTDNYRIAAYDQLGAYGRILDAPVRAAANAEELRRLLTDFYDKRLILIDTAGMGQRDLRLAGQFDLLRQEDIPIQTYLVLSAASQARVMHDAIEAFSGCAPRACILTKLDESPSLGVALSTLIERQLPAAFLCDGQQVPEDLHPARTHLLLEKVFAASALAEEEDAEGGLFDFEDWAAYAHV